MYIFKKGGMMSGTEVRVETVTLDSSSNRQIKAATRTTALLQDRRDDIESAIREASTIIQESVDTVEGKSGWHVKRVDAKFGLMLAAEAGVVISRASAEASFELTITIERE